MLTLNCRLNELNDNGLFLVRLLQNQDFSTITGDTVKINKYSSVHLRSTLTRRERFEIFDANGNKRTEILTDAQQKHIDGQCQVYGETDDSLYQFYPVLELYNRGNRCMHCFGIPEVEHITNLSILPADGESHFRQINRLGEYFKWWINAGYFEPIAPREIDGKTALALKALFGGKSNIPVDSRILINNKPEKNSNN